MEPVFRPFCPRFGTLPTFVTLSLRNFKASTRCIRRPLTACFGSQTICPSCGFTSRSQEFCLESGKSLPAVDPMVKRSNGAKGGVTHQASSYRPAGAFLALKPQHFRQHTKRRDA